MMKKYLTTLMLFCIGSYGFAQIDTKTKPMSMDSTIESQIQNNFNKIKLPPADLNNIPQNSEKLITAVPVPVGVDFNQAATESVLPNGMGSIKRLGIRSQGATGITLAFDQFWLPQGAELHAYSKDGTDIRGAYTSWNNRADGIFAIQFMPGEMIILEYYSPASVTTMPILSLDKIYHSFLDVTDFDGEGESESCNIGVRCSQADDWRDEVRSVVRLRIDGGSCSGVLVNNTNEDRKTYVLSALHCVDNGDGVLSEAEINAIRTGGMYFDWESFDCSVGEDVYDNNNQTRYTLSGAEAIVIDDAHDLVLLEFDEMVPDACAPYYAGWNALGLLPKPTLAGIHHPAGDEKKISIEYDVPIDVISGYWNVTFDEGNAEPGTSGSPLFEKGGYVVGTASFGYGFDCSISSNINYGKISEIWSSAESGAGLASFLDNGDTGKRKFRGYDPLCGGSRTIDNTNYSDGSVTEEKTHRFLKVGSNVNSYSGSKVDFIASYEVEVNAGTTFFPGSEVTVCIANTDCASHPIVNIFGPSEVCRTSSATYRARVLYGTPPFKYEWFRGGDSKQVTTGSMSRTNTFVYTAGLFHFMKDFECEVTDANGFVSTHNPMPVDPVHCSGLTANPNDETESQLENDGEISESEKGGRVNQELLLYPNPASDFINIKIAKSSEDIAEIRILNISGETVDQITINEIGTNVQKYHSLDDYHSGMYLMQLVLNGEITSSQRFVVSR